MRTYAEGYREGTADARNFAPIPVDRMTDTSAFGNGYWKGRREWTVRDAERMIEARKAAQQVKGV